MFVSFHSNTMGVTCGAEITNAYGFTHNNCGVRFARFMLFCVVFCRSLFVLFFLMAIVLSVLFNLRILITALVYSYFSFFNRYILPFYINPSYLLDLKHLSLSLV
jgi:hypothetical protein